METIGTSRSLFTFSTRLQLAMHFLYDRSLNIGPQKRQATARATVLPGYGRNYDAPANFWQETSAVGRKLVVTMAPCLIGRLLVELQSPNLKSPT